MKGEECRIINLAVTSKAVTDDCDNAQNTDSYRDISGDKYELFNVMKGEYWDQIKRIKAVKLYPGKVIPGQKKDLKSASTANLDVVGGIMVVYELKSGDDYENGIYGIKCTSLDGEPVVLELKDNEYINSIYGTGTEYIKSLTIETNFYRKIKVGAKGGAIPGKEDTTPTKVDMVQGFSQSAGEAKNMTRVVSKSNFQGSSDNFSIQMPAGAKVVSIAGSADEYLRCVFAYFKI